MLPVTFSYEQKKKIMHESRKILEEDGFCDNVLETVNNQLKLLMGPQDADTFKQMFELVAVVGITVGRLTESSIDTGTMRLTPDENARLMDEMQQEEEEELDLDELMDFLKDGS